MSVKPITRPVATASQKENFKEHFAAIVANNAGLRNHYSIQFFETAQKSNYVFTGLNGKSLNVLSMMTVGEAEQYRVLKGSWQQ